jgi:Porin subfamily
MTGKDTGATGVNEIAYTFDLGSGVSLTFGADERATKSLTNLSVNSALKVGAEPTDYHQGEVWPDAFVNLRADESWGYVAVSATAHNVDATYYTQSGTSGSLATSGVPGYSCTAAGFAGGVGAVNTPLSSCGHPSDKVGWAVNGGGEVRIPMGGGLTDRIGAAARVAVGATSFTNTNVASPALFGAGNNLGVGWMTDGVFVNGSGIELTTSWGVQAGYEHAFTNTFRGDLVAGYGAFSYDSQAQTYFSDALGCTATGSGAAKQTSVNVNSGTNCSPNYQFLEAGVRGTWTPIPNLYFSAQLTYYYVWTAFNGDNLNLSNAGANPVSGDRPSGIYSTGNQNIFSFITRVQRSFNVSDN